MKKFLLIILAFLSSICLHAQDKDCNRLFLHQNGKDANVYIMDKIDSLSFAKYGIADNLVIYKTNGTKEQIFLDDIDSLTFKNVEGRVAADVEIVGYTSNSITLNVTRTASCVGFKMTCLPFKDIAGMWDDDLIKFVGDNIENTYKEDLEGVEFTDLGLTSNTEYAIITVGIDEYGLLCDVVKKRFATPHADLVGKPQLEVEVLTNNLYDFTLGFTPNNDVSKYRVLLGEEGVLEDQYSMFAYVFGWKTMSDMIKDWGMELTGINEHYYDDKSPNTVYELYILTFDINGIAAPYTVFKFKTKNLGGEGIAKVDIELGAYKYTEWPYEDTLTISLPSQFLTFTPNDQASAYRFNVILEENYNADPDGYQEDLCSDPFTTTQDWFQHETLTTDFQIDPGTSCVAIAAAKNANDEWGPVTELFFTTPDEVPDKATAPAKRVVVNKKEKRHYEKVTIDADKIIPLIVK